MDINITLLGQIITFAIFVWFTYKFVWPPIVNIMQERHKKIADGLAAAEQGHNELELAQHKVKEMLTDAKAQAASILEQANQRANHIVEDAKSKAREEGERLLKIAQGEVEQEYNAARDALMQNVSKIAVIGAEKILQKEISAQNNDWLVDELVKEI